MKASKLLNVSANLNVPKTISSWMFALLLYNTGRTNECIKDYIRKPARPILKPRILESTNMKLYILVNK